MRVSSILEEGHDSLGADWERDFVAIFAIADIDDTNVPSGARLIMVSSVWNCEACGKEGRCASVWPRSIDGDIHYLSFSFYLDTTLTCLSRPSRKQKSAWDAEEVVSIRDWEFRFS